MKPGEQPYADPVGKGFVVCVVNLYLQVVRSEDRDLPLVITFVDYVSHRLLDPFRRFGGAEFVQHQHLSIIDGGQDLQFRRMSIRIVAILDLFQKVPEVIEQTGYALENQFFQDGDREVGLPNTTTAQVEQADVYQRVFLNKLSRVHRGALNGNASRFKVVETALAVAIWDSGLLQQQLSPRLHPAL